MAGQITRVRAVFHFEDQDGIEYDVQEVGIELDTETIMTFDVEHDGAVGIATGVGGRPKNRPSPSR